MIAACAGIDLFSAAYCWVFRPSIGASMGNGSMKMENTMLCWHIGRQFSDTTAEIKTGGRCTL
jgi:hypothetical protein